MKLNDEVGLPTVEMIQKSGGEVSRLRSMLCERECDASKHCDFSCYRFEITKLPPILEFITK
jgi:hypothetical protein